ncbi:MAG TPA: UvrD-helicase domain-containing protein [Candidatus Paceibacterota bacterium]|nr:UvrD-helicase domain-containing protein [Verrucomicrobiota bacterium]HOX02840.1 UvrD-helicase domain-containing protein [Verrucomicrobiota bacterium]HRZ45592.1 UvrD-helicase domain-containing protein [Candidatus Paceibacterota bacterium]HRZ91405.1 UvrD-helicase domain-containing protein [Candidatus Paceibacterota bacterium]
MVDLSLLNSAQRQAVEWIDGPVLILAGAGTGKTRVITYRVAHLLDRGIPAGHILGVTFTNKAAREMRQRVQQLAPRSPRRRAPEAGPDLVISTFHSLGARILRQHIERLGYKRNFAIFDEADQLGIVRQLLSQVSLGTDKADPAEVRAMISRWKSAGEGARPSPDESLLAELAHRLQGRYEAALRACNAVDYDDLIGLPLRLLRDEPDVLAACRDRFRYVMVDEYQDTSASQFELVHLIAREHRNLCVVGDDDQSIYAWRGADLRNLLDLERHYPEVRIVRLEQNYRSTRPILEAANALIRHNLRRRPKKLWSEIGAGVPIVARAFESDEAEAAAAAENIECDRLVRGIPWSDQAVLFRTNGQARPLEAAFRKAGIRYRLVGGQSFFDRREIRDALAYLRMLLHPQDDNSLLRIANVPARGLSEATLQRLLTSSQERRCSVFEVLQHPELIAGLPSAARGALAQFGQWIAATRAPLFDCPSLALQPWAESFLDQIQFFAEVRRQEKNPETADHRIRNLRDLLAMLDDPGRSPGAPAARLAGFLEDLALDRDRFEDREDAGNLATLITLHSVKGLEFPHVQIVGIEDGLLPHAHACEAGALDEERRLLYVGITRAMRTLQLSYCKTRKRYGQPVPRHPSPFLQELPPEALTWEDPRAARPVPAAQRRGLFAMMRAKVNQPADPPL